MKKLGRDSFDKARRFLETQARPLDWALFEVRFDGAPTERALTELARFQNDDGGFGHALEPDLRTPASSALATEIGLRLLGELGCDSEHPMVGKAVRYVLDTFDEQTGVWRVVPPESADHPHAPWWGDEDGGLARTFDDFLVIPRAGIVAALHCFSSLVPADWLADVTEKTVADIETDANLGSGGGAGLRYTLYLAEAEGLPQELRDRLVNRMRDVVPHAVIRDPEKWSGYCLTPLKVAWWPESPVADLVWDDVQENLDYQIGHQAADGAWEPNWTWGGSYPETWEQARQEWRGELTLRTLTALQAFGRIEERWGEGETRRGGEA